jgi:UDP-N-acetyl-D-glucosamine dehydrogenase
MPYYVVERATKALNKQQKCLNGSRVLVLGVAYKKDVGDLRESPGLKIVGLLADEGALVEYNDPHVPGCFVNNRKYVSVNLTPERLAMQDLVIIATDHSRYDMALVVEGAGYILDTRNATRGVAGQTGHIEYL